VERPVSEPNGNRTPVVITVLAVVALAIFLFSHV
jgi:hypothetical protein